MNEMRELLDMILRFRDERDWKQFHNPKDLAISLTLEASELLEHFQWKTSEEAAQSQHEGLKDELADVAWYTLLLAHELGIDLREAMVAKLAKNAEKYPADKVYGSSKKYNCY